MNNRLTSSSRRLSVFHSVTNRILLNRSSFESVIRNTYCNAWWSGTGIESLSQSIHATGDVTNSTVHFLASSLTVCASLDYRALKEASGTTFSYTNSLTTNRSYLFSSSYLPAYSDAYLILDIVRLGIEMTCSRSSFRIGCRAMTSTMHFVDPGCSQYMCVHAVLDLLVPEVGDFPIKFDFLLWWLAWGHLSCCALLLVRSLVQASIIGLPDKVTRGLDFSHFGNLAFLPQG